jgi:hypothetical protein
MAANPIFFIQLLGQLHQSFAFCCPHAHKSSSHTPLTIGLQTSYYPIQITCIQYSQLICWIHIIWGCKVHHMTNNNVVYIFLGIYATMLCKINATKTLEVGVSQMTKMDCMSHVYF